MINARLMSDKPAMDARLVDYFANYGEALRQIRQRAAEGRGRRLHRCVLSGGARARRAWWRSFRRDTAFHHRGHRRGRCTDGVEARRIGLVSPYPAGLNEASVAYWRSQGFDPVEIASVFNTESAFHPIYSLEGSAATKALRSLEGKSLDAIIMLGTGMPTLAPIAETIGWSGAPVMSCNLCLAWRVVEALDGKSPSSATLEPWLHGEGWVARLKAQMQI